MVKPCSILCAACLLLTLFASPALAMQPSAGSVNTPELAQQPDQASPSQALKQALYDLQRALINLQEASKDVSAEHLKALQKKVQQAQQRLQALIDHHQPQWQALLHEGGAQLELLLRQGQSAWQKNLPRFKELLQEHLQPLMPPHPPTTPEHDAVEEGQLI
ncbi:hypothetical protein Mmc1_3007 [Magnetococcus marinus MC-1]|uniref:Uncharacterized protein n=1 Tax=Magnetococcus marinus (strain ATCC BAA-1437 / JCM 17883 / MC-1) TaxID=156889 RepID=A0LC05_MAGMM|nr:hypothetical protein [Magnetococcus marinus]ABK45498.1 hypothetical protein Mmc1_3007 [Magnetococcus marinus MC-1]